MLEFILQILGEFLLQAIGEALVELGLHSIPERFRRSLGSWRTAISCAIFGTVFGVVSLGVFPAHLVPAGWMRLVSLVVTPLGVGLAMAGLGAWRAARGDPVMRIDTFVYGFLFALAWALVRFRFAT